jgi:hypothetical protein
MQKLPGKASNGELLDFSWQRNGIAVRIDAITAPGLLVEMDLMALRAAPAHRNLTQEPLKTIMSLASKTTRPRRPMTKLIETKNGFCPKFEGERVIDTVEDTVTLVYRVSGLESLSNSNV